MNQVDYIIVNICVSWCQDVTIRMVPHLEPMRAVLQQLYEVLRAANFSKQCPREKNMFV